MSYPTQWSCGHEWEGKRGRFPVPADIFILSMYSPAPMGAFKALLPKKIVYHIAVVLYRQCLQWLYIYIYISIFLGSSLVLCFCVGVFCTSDAFHNKIRNDSSDQVCVNDRLKTSQEDSQTCLPSVLCCSQGACAFIPWYLWLLGIFNWWSMRHAASWGQSQFLWHHWRHLLQPLWYALLSLFF